MKRINCLRVVVTFCYSWILWIKIPHHTLGPYFCRIEKKLQIWKSTKNGEVENIREFATRQTEEQSMIVGWFEDSVDIWRIRILLE